MNIFYTDSDPVIAAQKLGDKHVVKMILESIQMLSTAHRILDGKEYIDSSSGRKIKRWSLDDNREHILYKATHINHPSNAWVRTSVENYLWLVEHMFAMGEEYTHRYGKRHKSIVNLGYTLQSPPFNLKSYDMTQIPSCMPEEYILGSQDPVANYRNYYKYAKVNMHTWKNRTPPTWLNIKDD
jgi:hypothetical protein